MDKIVNHPGFFGLTSQGVILIHADWPMYPEEHGEELALVWLSSFPTGTRFRKIDDIDRCLLFVADLKNTKPDPFDDWNFHVAVWHEDLIELHRKGLIEGVVAVSDREREELFRQELLENGPLMLRDGTPLVLPPLDEYEEEGEEWPTIAKAGLSLTRSGHERANALLLSVAEDLAILGERVVELRKLGYYDTAVREACVRMEYQIKSTLASTQWGERLIEELVDRLRKSGVLVNTQEKVIRGLVRGVFKFIRNEYMHNFVDLDAAQCSALLLRIARAKVWIDEVLTRLQSVPKAAESGSEQSTSV